MQYELGFIGAGNMAEAIARAAVERAIVRPDHIIAADPTPGRREVFEHLGAAVRDNNAAVVADARQVVLAVKPQMLGDVAADLAQLRDDQVLISIMAGLSTQKIAEAVGKPVRVVRVMPNTPLMAGAGMAGVCLGQHASEGDDALALKLLRGAGEAIQVRESDMDAITAIAGSGPAYVFYLAEAMQRAAGELGLEENARLLVNQTILGAAKLLVQSEDTPAELRQKVTSPGGTTEAAINHMQSNKSQDIFVNAIKAAAARSKELGG